MSIFNWFRKSEITEQRASISNHSLTGADLVMHLGGGGSYSGVAVNSNTALQVSVTRACIKAISEDLAGLSYHVYRRTESGKERAFKHPLYRLLHDEANPDMTSETFRQAMTAQVLIFGNAYAYIEKINQRAVALYPLPADTVKPFRSNGQLLYRVNTNSKPVTLTPDQILHIKDFSLDGITGKSVIETNPQVFGFTIAADRYGQKFFETGAMVNGVLECDNQVSDQVKKHLKESWSSKYSGLENSHKTPLLEEGIKFNPIAQENRASQYLELRKFQVLEICRLFRIPPHKVGDLERATFSNIEEQGIDYVRSCLRAWVIRWESEINRKLFFESEKAEYFAEMNIDAMQRGDQTTRYTNYATAITNGWLTPKRVAALENLETTGLSDTPIQPLNMAPATDTNQTDSAQESNANQTGSESDSSSSAADNESKPGPSASRDYSILIEDAARRVLTKECNAIKRAAKKYKDDAAAFDSWATEFYADHEQTIRSTFQPVMLTAFKNEAPEMLDMIVQRHTQQSLSELQNSENIDHFLEAQMSKANNGELWISKT